MRGDVLLATAHTVHAFIDRQGRPVRPPPAFAKKMEEIFRQSSANADGNA
jgi:acyl-CoA thioester hydrolase